MNNYTWRKTTYEPPDTAFKGDPFDNPEEISTPYQYFQQFIDSEMIEQLTEQTNIYAFQQTGKSLAVTQKELEQVIGMYFGMGLVRMPNSRMYWENNTCYAPVADIMSRNRFLTILSHLHFVNNLSATKDQTQGDKLWKIRPWLTKFRENCLKLIPEEFNSIDQGSSTGAIRGDLNNLKNWGAILNNWGAISQLQILL